MFQVPFNNLIIKVDTKYIRNISNIMRMSYIQNGSSVNPSDCVNIIGEIVSVPKKISAAIDYEGFSLKDIQVGDKAIFSYLVIYSFLSTGVNDDPVYRNMFYYHGEEYFVCDIQQLFGVIRNDQIIMLNGYSMIYDFDDPKIFVSTSGKKKLRITQSEVMHIGNGRENYPELVEVSPEDTVYFNPAITTKYQIGGKHFRIISQNYILGKTDVTGQDE